MNEPGWSPEAEDANRDAFAFILAVQRDDREALEVIYSNSDPFSMAWFIACHFLGVMKMMAIRNFPDWDPDEYVRWFLESLQSELT